MFISPMMELLSRQAKARYLGIRLPVSGCERSLASRPAGLSICWFVILSEAKDDTSYLQLSVQGPQISTTQQKKKRKGHHEQNRYAAAITGRHWRGRRSGPESHCAQSCSVILWYTLLAWLKRSSNCIYKEDSLRADRLLSMLLLLQTRGRMTARELAARLEVSERTIYRDLDALSLAGVPIYTERGPGGGCELLNGYQTKLTGLTEMEVRALFLLGVSHPLTDLGLDHALEDALLKLSAALPSTSRASATQVHQRIHLDASLPSHNGEALLHLQIIQQALWQDRTLRLTCTHQCEQSVNPYGLVSKAGEWYLVGAIAGEMRVLRVSRIQAAQMTEEHFTRPEVFDLATYWINYNARLHESQPYSNVRKKRNSSGHLA